MLTEKFWNWIGVTSTFSFLLMEREQQWQGLKGRAECVHQDLHPQVSSAWPWEETRDPGGTYALSHFPFCCQR